jgi:flagellar motility protein MotE (MotC chaperone)
MISAIPKFRFLPATIFVAALMLTVKIGSIWEGFDGIIHGSISIAGAEAQQPEGLEPTPVAAPKEDVEGAEGTEAAEGEGEGEDEGESEGSRMVTEDPTLLTQAEIDLLQQLADRREELEGREKEIEMRIGLLKAAESRIDKKVDDLKILQGTIEKLIKTYDAEQDAKMTSLVKIYENMKPQDAARIFEELDMNTLLLVAERMKERKLAPVMAKMNPAKAKEMTVELSRLRQLPQPGAGAG